MRSLTLSLLLALATSAAAEDPQWLTDARAREAKLGRERKIEAPDGWFTTRAPGKLAGNVEKDEDGDYTFNVDIGIASQIECLILRESQDPPNFLKRSADGTFEFLAGQHGELENKTIERVDARAIGGAIAMETSWLYLAKGASGPALGSLHLAYAEKHGAGIYCVKSELGYAETFRTIFDAVVQNLEVAEPPAAPRFTEIAVMAIGGQKIGITFYTIREDADGDKKQEQWVHSLIAATSESLIASTNYDLQWVNGDDLSLINAVSMESEAGEIETNLSLKWSNEKGRWLVAGKFGGKDLALELPEDAAPASTLAMERDQRDALAAPDALGRTLTWSMWSEADPSRVVEATSTITTLLDAKRAKAVQSLGPMKMESILERATGRTQSATMQVGPTTVTIESVYVQGAP